MKTAPYGSWCSTITTDLMTQAHVGLSNIRMDNENIYWLESRPSEGGRSVIMKYSPDGTKSCITPDGYNVRSRVHEYGGAPYTIHEENIFFCNDRDQQIYQQSENGEIKKLTNKENARFSDLVYSPLNEHIIAVQEVHDEAKEATNRLISFSIKKPELINILASGADFYASPALSHDCRSIAWLTWQHPDMPWDKTQLWKADVCNNGLIENITACLTKTNASLFQPQWSPSGELFISSDENNWWNICRVNQNSTGNLYPENAEFGWPQWVFGMSTYGFLNNGSIVCSYCKEGIWYLGRMQFQADSSTQLENLSDQFPANISYISDVRTALNKSAFIASGPAFDSQIIVYDNKFNTFEVIATSSHEAVDLNTVSQPQNIVFSGSCNLPTYAFYYPPVNPDYKAPAGEKPPLLVKSHGGPTAATNSAYESGIQYWTSRGFAVVDVNYGGSTGFGRKYRERLNGQWGVVDVEDCIKAALYLVEKGLADEKRLAIRGSSAGGYTTLAALTFYDTFTAGASYYGVSELESLANDTHKFEAHYLDRLIGPYPESQAIYKQRSPIHSTEKLSAPIIFFQGLEDKVVPPEQAESMVNSLKKKNLPVAYIKFTEEGHGFRQAKNIKKALEAELDFYGGVYGFKPESE